MKKIFFGFFCAILMLGFVEPGPTQDAAWNQYIRSQKRFQVAVHHRLRLNWPELKDAVDASQEHQLLLADMKTARFQYLLANEPGRIIRDQGFEAFVQFEWNEEDEMKLKEDSSDFKNLEKRLEKFRQELYTDPEYKVIQERMEGLYGTQEYNQILARFRFVGKKVEKLLV